MTFWFTGPNTVKGQNPYFNQGTIIRQLNNPALLGMGRFDINSASRISTNIQAQWLSLERRLVTNAIEGDIIANNNTSFGINLYSTDLFSGNNNNSSYKHFSTGLSYCYSIKLKNGNLNLALNGQFSNFNFGTDNFLWEDQIDPGMTGFELPTKEPINQLTINAVHFSAGVLYHNKNLFLGGAVFNINQPNISFYNQNNQKIQSRFVVNGGMVFETKRLMIIPNVICYLQGDNFTISENINFRKGNIYYGLGLKQNTAFGQVAHSINGNFGYRKGSWFFNYSNNVNLTIRVANNPMTHELGICYLLPSSSKKQTSLYLPTE